MSSVSPSCEALAEPSQRRGVDQRGAQLGQLALVVGGEAAEEILADHELEDRVAEVLEAFVVVPGAGGLAVLVVPGGVGHRLAKQFLLAELDADPLLEVAQALELLLSERRRRLLGRRDVAAGGGAG